MAIKTEKYTGIIEAFSRVGSQNGKADYEYIRLKTTDGKDVLLEKVSVPNICDSYISVEREVTMYIIPKSRSFISTIYAINVDGKLVDAIQDVIRLRKSSLTPYLVIGILAMLTVVGSPFGIILLIMVFLMRSNVPPQGFLEKTLEAHE